MSRISVLVADDSLIVREGIRALVDASGDFEVVGLARDFDDLVASAESLQPMVIVTDIRMPPNFQQEGVIASRLVRKRNPGTGVVILSQYDDPEYAVSLLAEGAAGCAYLLKDRVSDGDELARAIKTVSCGGSALDPKIVESLIKPIDHDELSVADTRLLHMVAEGRSIKAIAIALRTTPADAADSVEKLFLILARNASAGRDRGLQNLRMLHQAIVRREEQGETLSRLLPTGVGERLRNGTNTIGQTDSLVVTVLMSDIRGYSAIAETADPIRLCDQLMAYRGAASDEILREHGTVMQFVGDAVMAVFGAPEPLADHADRALAAAMAMHRRQLALNHGWETLRRPAFNLGIGLSTGQVAAALLGSAERMEYSVVGDVVNLSQRLQQLAAAGESVLSESTYRALSGSPEAEQIGPTVIPGRRGLVTAYRLAAQRDK
jgi:adenylate cyclase